MTTSRKSLLAVILIVMLAASWAVAQRPPTIRVQEDLSDRDFRIRVVNQLKHSVYYKLVGGKGRGYAYQTLRPGEASTRDPSSGGEKVLCVWDMNGRVVMACVVLVDRNGKIPMGPMGWEEGDREEDDDGPPPGFKPRMPELPRIRVVPE